jgi:hypothetical protein
MVFHSDLTACAKPPRHAPGAWLDRSAKRGAVSNHRPYRDHGIHAPGRWVARLLYLRQLTDLIRRRKGSELCQQVATRRKALLFNHLTGGSEQRVWHRHAEGGPKIPMDEQTISSPGWRRGHGYRRSADALHE